jgi:hypothetical protein
MTRAAAFVLSHNSMCFHNWKRRQPEKEVRQFYQSYPVLCLTSKNGRKLSRSPVYGVSSRGASKPLLTKKIATDPSNFRRIGRQQSINRLLAVAFCNLGKHTRRHNSKRQEPTTEVFRHDKY